MLDNSFGLDNIFDIRLGKITRVVQENSKNPNDKRLVCDISFMQIGEAKNVPLWGGGIDHTTKFPHGIYSPPRLNQLVIVFFLGATVDNPVAAIPLPYNHNIKPEVQNLYNTIMESVDDLAIFHYSGSRLILRANGKFDIQKRIEETPGNFVNHNLTLEIKFESNKSKKILTDVQNNITISLTPDEVKITDGDGQFYLLDALNNKVVVQRASGQTITMENNKNTINVGTQSIVQDSTGTTKTTVNGNLEVLV